MTRVPAPTGIARAGQPPELLTPAEVAALFRIDPKTVSRWRAAGRLPAYTRTLGGHWRYLAGPLRALAAGQITPDECTQLLLAGNAR